MLYIEVYLFNFTSFESKIMDGVVQTEVVDWTTDAMVTGQNRRLGVHMCVAFFRCLFEGIK